MRARRELGAFVLAVVATVGLAGCDKPVDLTRALQIEEVSSGWHDAGMVDGNVWRIRNRNTTGTAARQFTFGRATDRPVAGDWDGNGRTDLGVWHPATAQFSQRLTQELNKMLSPAGWLRDPNYTTANLPACTTSNYGAIAYDLTLNQQAYCNGATWIYNAGGGGGVCFWFCSFCV